MGMVALCPPAAAAGSVHLLPPAAPMVDRAQAAGRTASTRMGRAAAIVRAPAARRDRGQTPFRATVRKTRLAIVTTHPVQYQVPWYRALANRPGVDLSVL